MKDISKIITFSVSPFDFLSTWEYVAGLSWTLCLSVKRAKNLRNIKFLVHASPRLPRERITDCGLLVYFKISYICGCRLGILRVYILETVKNTSLYFPAVGTIRTTHTTTMVSDGSDYTRSFAKDTCLFWITLCVFARVSLSGWHF